MAAGPRPVTSRVVCQGEGGGEALVVVFVHEDGEQDAVHRGLVLEGAHRAGAAADFAEAPLDRVGNRHDARGAPRPARIALIVAYGATIRAAGRWEHEAWAGRSVR